MQPNEVAGLRYFAPMNQNLLAAHFDKMQNNISSFQFSNLVAPAYHTPPHFYVQPLINEFAAQSISSNSASDDADEQQMSVVDLRKKRRIISNRESARRSRMRKQRHLDELWAQVVRLGTENRQLIDRLNDVSGCHERVAQENVKLKEEAEQLRQSLKDMQLDCPYSTIFRDLEEVPCNTGQLRAESSNQSAVTSSGF